MMETYLGENLPFANGQLDYNPSRVDLFNQRYSLEDFSAMSDKITTFVK